MTSKLVKGVHMGDYMSYGLHWGLGGTYRGLYRVLGAAKGYTTNLVQGSYGGTRSLDHGLHARGR